MVVVKKKQEGEIRICQDFRDLNKACPKDEFPLPSVDALIIDATAGHEMYSVCDGYKGYNQIKMDPADAKKTAFRTPFGNFYFTVMPFGLKNAEATYQRTMTAMFHDMLHHKFEFYMDDLVIKSIKEETYLKDLREVFERCRKFRLRLNPKKCVFGVAKGKILGHVIDRSGIQVDKEKQRAVIAMPPPSTQKELKTFIGKHFLHEKIHTSTCRT